MTGSRWGAGFSAVGRFVGEIEAAAAGQGFAAGRAMCLPAMRFSCWIAAARPF